MNSEKGDEYTKIIIGTFCFLHLLTVILLSWMLYRKLKQNKKDKWSLIVPIGCLFITLFIPYSGGEWDFFLEGISSFMVKLGKFCAYASLLMGIACIILYFFDVKIEKGEKQDGYKENER
ncbi:MAG: hypothetical protein I3270_00845 [Candidatus Moeniiplasma glomeromycotorum]|nr:hypothetical protein [Candidatus Moeniiplasma glomeromycotorum]MCE8162160.1 hypothetical protein [Candidatus Moeniiplasma glomeromycotorum]MCE8166185.1 hypothetical protein [Candidatus Moeniiplasma glomeromycotorum]MCE8166559.1 hypothetical protein [Candidatus Moeniiplasma glomeromycotorum]